MSAGKGYQYLLRSVAVGDGNRTLDIPLTRYYAETGTPPGRWLGKGVAEFGAGELSAGDVVTQEQLARLLGAGCDPVTGEPLGRAYARYATVDERIAARVASLDATLSDGDRAAAIAHIRAEEVATGPRTAVAGFDLTFSVPKSVSVLWGVADEDTQAMIVEAHHAAVAEVMGLFEREVAFSRTGTDAVATVDVVGIAATAYDHWDSRAGDPQLHTHVVVSNRARSATDGKWRTLYSRQVHGSVVALSEHYNAVLADRLTGTFGVGWEHRDRGKGRSRAFEIAGVPDGLIDEFSSRTRHIDAAAQQLVAEYVARHGKRPSGATYSKLRAQATLATRPPKELYSLADLTAGWRARAARLLGRDPVAWAHGLTHTPGERVWRAGDIPESSVEQVAASVLADVSARRSTWRHWNLWAEASRQTMGWRFASAEDREAVVGRIVDQAKHASVALTPAEAAPTPTAMRRADGVSFFRPPHATVFSSRETLDAEDRLLTLATDRTAPHASVRAVEAAVVKRYDDVALSAEQQAALEAVASSGRRVDLLVGPAGTGKTTAMQALLRAWTAQHGKGSVAGLAPSAAAAQVLAEDLGIATENTAKWLHERARGRATFQRGQLVIVDEATLADTSTLLAIANHAQVAGAKVLLVGDWAQLQSVEAGGAFALLADARDDVAELGEIHRFTHAWEKPASLALRTGDTTAIDAYESHARLRGGTTEEMLDAAYAAWRADHADGKATLLVTDSTATVQALNARARAERIIDGDTSTGRTVALADGLSASVGDHLITRRNARRLTTLRGGWVRNGDRWKVLDVRRNGSVLAGAMDQAGKQRRGATVVLPPSYVAEHVELGYAVTAHRAQGMTVDTAHVVVAGGTTRENLYVSMTRGRESNIAYVALDKPDETHATPQPEDITARSVLHGVLNHSGIELSAHQTIDAEAKRWGSIAQLAAEYETIAAFAQRPRWERIIRSSGLRPEEADAAIASPAMDALAASLRRAEARGLHADELVPMVVAERTVADADDVAAVIRHRVERVTARHRGKVRGRLVAGLVPAAVGVGNDEVREALDRRRDLMEAQALALAEEAVAHRLPWTRTLGSAPLGVVDRMRWITALSVIAAYRDRYDITNSSPLGSVPGTDLQAADRAAAEAAVRQAQTVTADREGNAALAPRTPTPVAR
ncbi:MobF family relaxase [Xylanimonas cellulosilytica]|nr:MobF family relaxase [Xylanimonas cellulosilytica]